MKLKSMKLHKKKRNDGMYLFQLFQMEGIMRETIYNNNEALVAFQYNMGGATGGLVHGHQRLCAGSKKLTIDCK